MKRELVVRDEVFADASEAADWYDQRLDGLGERFLLALHEGIASIQDAPFQYPIHTRSIRRARIERFPYGVYFVANESSVTVLAVMHLMRNPRLIKRTLRGR